MCVRVCMMMTRSTCSGTIQERAPVNIHYTQTLLEIKSTKTTSMEVVSTGVLEKIKNI